MRFYLGWHQPGSAKHLNEVPMFMSVNRLWTRVSKFEYSAPWIMDSGAFSIVSTHGGYPEDRSPAEYAKRIRKHAQPSLVAAVTQDYMCELFILEKTGLTVEIHQTLTIDRYLQLLSEDTAGVYIMPVLQGFEPKEYASHVRQYGDLLGEWAYVGVGSICKRNSHASSVLAVLEAIKAERPDLRLHGFGLKVTALQEEAICQLLESADSMAWSYHERRKGRNANDPVAAIAWQDQILNMRKQLPLF